MRELEELTADDLNVDGCVRLMLELLRIKMKDRDTEWVGSEQCLKTLEHLPDKILPKAASTIIEDSQLYTYNTTVSPEALQQTMLKHITHARAGKRGTKTCSRDIAWRNNKNRQWAITNPNGVVEVVSDLQAYANKYNIKIGFLRTLVGLKNGCKGFKARKIMSGGSYEPC